MASKPNLHCLNATPAPVDELRGVHLKIYFSSMLKMTADHAGARYDYDNNKRMPRMVFLLVPLLQRDETDM